MIPLIVFASILLLLILILHFKLPAFLALLLVSLLAGLALGMSPDAVLSAVQNGMGGTLGFIAVVVGLGAMLGALLEYSGGVHILAKRMLQKAGADKATWILSFIGFIVAIPVFFDVAFILLVPMLYSLARDSKISVKYFAMPTLAGLMVAHAFIPPTPGPMAVAQLLNADLGLVIVFGLLAGLPAMMIAGPWFCRRYRNAPLESFLCDTAEEDGADKDCLKAISLSFTLMLIALPLILILSSTIGGQLLADSRLLSTLNFLGHPFTALSLTTLLALVVLSRSGASKQQLGRVMGGAMEPAGVVVLVTGAGGVFKQILTDSGAGLVLAEAVAAMNVLPVVFAFLVALLVRVSQGSATVAMISAAGLLAPIQQSLGLSGVDSALLVIAIAAGSSAFSHVNDSGFWLVSRYLHLDTKETLQSWTLMSGLAGCSGFIVVLLFSMFL